MECQGPGERMALRDQRVASDPLVSSDLLDLSERRVNWVYPDCPAILEDKDPRVLSDSQDSLVPTARRELGVSVESQDQGDRGVQRVPEVRGDRGAQLENLEPREPQEVTGHMDLLEKGDCLGLREPMVSPDLKDLQDPLGRMDCPDTLDKEEKLVSKVKWGHPGLLEWLDLRDPLERLDPWESAATLDHQAPLESRDSRVLQERRAPKETRDHLEALVKMGPQD